MAFLFIYTRNSWFASRSIHTKEKTH